jgi:hypothetical protein
MSANWWQPASDHALVDWDRRWRERPQQSDAGINSSGFYVQRMRAALDLEIELMDQAAARVNLSAQQCVRSTEITNPTDIANDVLGPIFRKARESIRAEPANAEARGGQMRAFVEPHVEQFVRDCEAARRVRADALAVSLQQRKAQLEMSERRELDERIERAASQTHAHVIEQAKNFVNSLGKKKSRARKTWDFVSSNQVIAGLIVGLILLLVAALFHAT